ncbi:MAG TPA: hypothetical protein DCQ51_22625 [Planktothrix sp. UBA8407]|jgi:hypothetical protein|nr:hypothetical protein [Planktothrix sp. UBA8407]HBK97416.1 hypothetical protein [Microcoleaceae cyanobacterium UBA10368]HCV30218.1 hypothetical protein [Microcoleaceae cyanobacterium UBA9251]
MDINKLIEEFKNISGRSSALKAWNQGKILKSIKDNPEYIERFGYIDFENFVEQYLEITARTANKYLLIYEIWQSEKVPEILKKNKNMLLEHLYTLIKPENEAIRDRILEAMANMEEYFEKNLENRKLKTIYREDDIISLVKAISESKKNWSAKDIQKVFLTDFINPRIKTSNQATQRDPRPKKNINTLHFNELAELYANEPVDEQSFVALFCTMFHLIKEKNIIFSWDTHQISFSKILDIKESFPDAEIEFYTYKNSLPAGTIQLNVEFEYESHNYIKHQHHTEDRNKCHLIICWLNNWSSPLYYAHILSIKELLETGEINLHFF